MPSALSAEVVAGSAQESAFQAALALDTALLPDLAPDWMRALAEVDAARRPLPTWLVTAVWNPWTCPAPLLPYLAAGLGLELWNEAWPEARQRETVAAIWRLKRNKTKLKGIRAYLALGDARLVAARRPRDRMWWSGGQSQAQRDEAAARMPRVRIYPTVKPATGSRAKAFWSGRVPQFWRPGRAWIASDAPARYAGRAVYVDGDTVAPVTLRGIDGILDVNVAIEKSAGASVAKLFWGTRRVWGRAAWMASDADRHVLAITPTRGAPGFAVPPGLVPSSVHPVRVSGTATAPVAKPFWGARRFAWGQAAWMASDAADHVYDEVVLFDPARATPARQPASFWGWSRFARASYTAEIRVDVSLTRPARQHGWGTPWGRSFWRRSSLTPFWDAVAATRTAQAFRDTVWIATALYEPIRFTAGLRLGDPGFDRFGDTRTLT